MAINGPVFIYFTTNTFHKYVSFTNQLHVNVLTEQQGPLQYTFQVALDKMSASLNVELPSPQTLLSLCFLAV